jgi:hypothetical protein
MKNLSKMLDSRKNIFTLYIIFCWITSWTAVGINPAHLFNFNSINIIYSIRGFVPIFNFFFLTFFLFYFRKIFYFRNIFFYLFLLYFILQIIGSMINRYDYFDLYYLINSFNILAILTFVFKKKNSSKIYNLFLYISLLILACSFFYYFVINFFFYFTNSMSLYNTWGIAHEVYSNKFNSYFPNVLGLSRNALIIFIFLFLYYHSKKNKLKNRFFYILPLIASSILFLESRTTISLYLLFLFLYFILFYEKNLKTIAKFLFIFFIIPILLFTSINYIKFHNLNSLQINANNNNNNNNNFFYSRNITLSNFSSDRTADWKNLINMSKNNLFGFGVQGDRHLYSKTASNGLLYAFVCSGYIGFFIFLTICILSLFYSLIFLIRNKFNEKKYVLFSSFLVFAILLRSIFETSFAVFGIDYIIFVYSIFYIQYNLFSKTK